jgi:hypothetical protein
MAAWEGISTPESSTSEVSDSSYNSNKPTVPYECVKTVLKWYALWTFATLVTLLGLLMIILAWGLEAERLYGSGIVFCIVGFIILNVIGYYKQLPWQ